MIEFADLDFTVADLHALGATRARNLAAAMVVTARRLSKYADSLAGPIVGRPRACRGCFEPFTLSRTEQDQARAGHHQRALCRRCVTSRLRERHERRAAAARRAALQAPVSEVAS